MSADECPAVKRSRQLCLSAVVNSFRLIDKDSCVLLDFQHLITNPPAIPKDIAHPMDTPAATHSRPCSIIRPRNVLNTGTEQAIAVATASATGVAMPTEPASVSDCDCQIVLRPTVRERHGLSDNGRCAECSNKQHSGKYSIHVVLLRFVVVITQSETYRNSDMHHNSTLSFYLLPWFGSTLQRLVYTERPPSGGLSQIRLGGAIQVVT